MSSINSASLPPAGTLMNPATGAPSPQDPAGRSSVAPADTAAEKKDERGFFDRMWGKEGFSFGALLDIINPLQHIPVVGTAYRAITGDSIGPAARIAGGTLFGGVFGLIASSIDSLVQEETGKDFGQHILALRGDADAPAGATTPTGRPERDDVLYAGNFSPRSEIPSNVAEAKEPDADVSIAVSAEPPPAPAPGAAQATQQAAAAQAMAAQPPVQKTAQAAPRVANNHTEAANGVGGAPVPFASSVNRAGRQAAALPTPQALAGDPALLRQMQTTRAQSTAIRAAAANADAKAPSFLDYTPKNAALRSAEADARLLESRQNGQAAKSPNEARAEAPAQAINPGTLPQVPADLISRMNMALEKYQTLQRAPQAPGVSLTQ